MPDEACRLAQAERISAAETNIINLCKKFDDHSRHEHEQLEGIRASIEAIERKLETNKGFIRGVAFTLSTLAAGIGYAFHQFFGNSNG